jgi:hypothetical protein
MLNAKAIKGLIHNIILVYIGYQIFKCYLFKIVTQITNKNCQSRVTQFNYLSFRVLFFFL